MELREKGSDEGVDETRITTSDSSAPLVAIVISRSGAVRTILYSENDVEEIEARRALGRFNIASIEVGR